MGQLLPNESINIIQKIRLTGELDVAALQKSLDTVVQRHESLRTTIVTVGGKPMQAIASALFKLPVRALFEDPTLAGLALVIEEVLLEELDAGENV